MSNLNMKTIIIAAGKGNRLYPLTEEIPKCLLDIAGKTILERQIESLRDCGIDNIIIVVGYKMEKVERIFKGSIKYVFNPFFQNMNNIVSLWLAREYLNSDLVLLNGDVLFERKILKELLKNEDDICLVVDKKDCDDEDYKVQVEGKRIIDMGKTIPHKAVFGEFIGITKASQRGAAKIKETLDYLIKRQDFQTWYDSAYLELVKKGEIITFLETKGRYWTEIDYIEDLKQARKYYENEKNVAKSD